MRLKTLKALLHDINPEVLINYLFLIFNDCILSKRRSKKKRTSKYFHPIVTIKKPDRAGNYVLTTRVSTIWEILDCQKAVQTT